MRLCISTIPYNGKAIKQLVKMQEYKLILKTLIFRKKNNKTQLT